VTPLLVVVAVGAERDAVLAGLGDLGVAVDIGAPVPRGAPVHVAAGGVGPAAAAASTATLIALAAAGGHPYQSIVNLGIGGGFALRAEIGDVLLGTRSVAADLGADSPDGFVSVADLGFGRVTHDTDPDLLARLTAVLPAARAGAILTVSTVTGTTGRAARLAATHPDAVGEAMEGTGVAAAADLHRLPFAEVRTVSNMIGPRDRDAWRIKEALAALADAAAAIGTLVG
jgi:futalosine hydrolase